MVMNLGLWFFKGEFEIGYFFAEFPFEISQGGVFPFEGSKGKGFLVYDFSEGKGKLGLSVKMDEKAKNFPSHMPSIRGGLIYYKGNLPYPVKFHHGNPAYHVKYHRGISTSGQKGSDEKCNPRKSEKVQKKVNFDFFERKKLHFQVVFSRK